MPEPWNHVGIKFDVNLLYQFMQRITDLGVNYNLVLNFGVTYNCILCNDSAIEPTLHLYYLVPFHLELAIKYRRLLIPGIIHYIKILIALKTNSNQLLGEESKATNTSVLHILWTRSPCSIQCSVNHTKVLIHKYWT